MNNTSPTSTNLDRTSVEEKPWSTRFTCFYQAWGTDDGQAFMEACLRSEAEVNPDLLHSVVLTDEPGSFGIRHIIFQFDLAREAEMVPMATMRTRGKEILTDLTIDTDGPHVTWVSSPVERINTKVKETNHCHFVASCGCQCEIQQENHDGRHHIPDGGVDCKYNGGKE